MARSAAAVKKALGALLPTLDLNTATERAIRGLVAERLGGPVDEHKKLIKDEIDAFLGRLAASQADEAAAGTEEAEDDDSDFEADDGSDEEEEGAAARRKAKRKAPPAGAASRAAKQAKKAAKGKGGAAAAAEGHSWHLGTKGQKYARVEEFKGVTRVDLRECYSGNDGSLKPGKKGIALQPEEWGALVAGMQRLVAAAHANARTFEMQLSSMRKATVGEFRGSVLVQVREYYTTPDGTQHPGKRGIALTLEQLEALAAAAPAITAALPPDAQAAAAAPAPAAEAEAAGAGGTVPSTSARPARKQPATIKADTKAQAGAQGEAGANGDAGGGADWVDLGGGGRRGRISEFKGKQYVDLREWYQKGDQWAPGSKGISLTPEQWGALCGAAAALSEAAEAGDESVRVELGAPTRQAYVNKFKGKVMVHLREMYDKGGAMQPGKKGIALSPEGWTQLVDAMPRLTQQLKAASR